MPTDSLIVELQRRGFDTTAVISQTRSERRAPSRKKVIPINRRMWSWALKSAPAGNADDQ
jgi:hypothetical protein